MTGTKGTIIDPWCPTFANRCNPGAHLRALRFAQLRCYDKITKDNLRILRESTACGEYDSRMHRLAAAGSSAKRLSSRRPVPHEACSPILTLQFVHSGYFLKCAPFIGQFNN